MQAERFQRVTDLFTRACALPAEQRGAFLDAACANGGGGAETRHEVERMLAADSRGGGVVGGRGEGAAFLARAMAEDEAAESRGRASSGGAGATGARGREPTLGADGGADGGHGAIDPPRSGDPAVRTMVSARSHGAYRLLRLIGEGGMGEVYEAEQANPRRTVAVKVIRRGRASRTAMRRFEQEAAALARLQHPGIAQVYEAGVDDSGQAFIAMELVRGLPLLEAANQRGLDTRARLALMAEVCDAVAHAHQRGVIHRDLKPANVLVNEEGQPKVLDFGVARVAEEPGSAAAVGTTMHTMAGQILGTIAYMSPEQARGQHELVDARSDVYALGVMFFELLAGRTPLPLRDKPLAEAARIIAEEDPERLMNVDREFRGDIDVIAARAMAKDPARRYPSADALGDDLRRTLAGDPIRARQDSAVYMLRRRLRRFQAVFAVVGVGVVSVAALAVSAVLRARDEARARQQMQALYDEARVERQRADANAERSRQQLRTSTIEQARLIAAAGGTTNAEPILWREHLAEPSDYTAWALRELYARMPCVRSSAAPTEDGRTISLSPDSRRAVTTLGGVVIVWKTEGWSEVMRFRAHESDIRWTVFAPDGRSVLTSADDATVCRWSVDNGALLAKVTLPQTAYRVAIPCGPGAPGLARVAVASLDGTVRLLDMSTGTPETRVLAAGLGELLVADISPDGRLVAAGGMDGLIGVWRCDTGERVANLANHGDGTATLAFSPDGSSLYTGGRDRITRRYSLDANGTVRMMAQHDGTNGTVRAIRFEPDGRHVLIPGYYRLDRLDAQSLRPAAEPSMVTTTAYDVVMPPDNSWQAVATTQYLMRVWEPRPHPDITAVRAQDKRVSSMAISPDGKLLATAADEGMVRLWNVPALTSAGELTGHPGRIRALAFNHDGTRLASGGVDTTLRVWNVPERRLDRAIEGMESEVHDCSFSPDGTVLAATPRYTGARLWRVDTGEEVLPRPEALKEMAAVRYAPDGRLIYTSLRKVFVRSADGGGTPVEVPTRFTPWQAGVIPDENMGAFTTWAGPTVLFDLGTGRVTQELKGHTQLINRVFPVRILDGGRIGTADAAKGAQTPPAGAALRDAVATVSGDGLMKLWDPRSGACLATLSAGQGGILCGVAIPGTACVITGHANGMMALWDLRHYDRHIEGNRDAMLLRLKAESTTPGGTGVSN